MKRLMRISLGVALAAALMASAFEVLAFFHAQKRTGEVKLDVIEYAFEPDTVNVDPGKVTFVVENKGRRRHGFAIDGVAGEISRIQPGETAKITVTLSTGNYTVYCPVKGHRDRGMVGTLGVGAVAEKPAPKPEAEPSRSGYY